MNIRLITKAITRTKVFLALSGMLPLSNALISAEHITDNSPSIKIARYSVKTMEEAVQAIAVTCGGDGVAVAFDFDDTLFSKEIVLENGQTLRYLEKSSFTDLSLNSGSVHPIFKAVNERLGLNLAETGQSFKSIRRHFMASCPELPLNLREERYYSVEEGKGVAQLKGSLETLRSQGATMCIVSAAGGERNSVRIDCGCTIGFPEGNFLRGYKKFEQLVTFVEGLPPVEGRGLAGNEYPGPQQTNHKLPRGNPDPIIHTLILIDDTQSYIDAWIKHARAAIECYASTESRPSAWPENSRIRPSKETGVVTVVGILYDFLDQHSDFVEQKMVEEFLALYGEDYHSNPLMQPFLKIQVLPVKKKHKETQRVPGCILF